MIFTDCLLLCLLVPLYIMAFHFILSPLDEYYGGTWQSMCAPLSLIPIFCFKSYDVLFMGIQTFLMNLYVAYYVIDPESNESYG